MNTATRQPAMLRKPILMPPDMIQRIDTIAKKQNVSFAEVVRTAINTFDGMPSDEESILEALAETMLGTVQDTLARIEQVEKKLDDTHLMIGNMERVDGN